jgi:hypothetical protein
VIRIFSVLAAFSTAFLLTTLLLGLYLQSVGDIRDPHDTLAQQYKTVHFLAGLGSGLCTILAHSLAVTYFIGTGRWCKEVCDTYKLDPAFTQRARQLKRRSFPYALACMLVVLVIMAFGAAADPAARVTAQPIWNLTWTQSHLFLALAGMGVIVWASVAEWNYIHANGQLIEEIMVEVKRIRQAKGLET